MACRDAPSPVLLVLVLVALLGLVMEVADALECYIDIHGVKKPDSGDEPIDVSRFKVYECVGVSGTIVKVQDKSLI